MIRAAGGTRGPTPHYVKESANLYAACRAVAAYGPRSRHEEAEDPLADYVA